MLVECRYVYPQVVAPVRETCAQTIGVILKHTDAETVKRVMMVLLTLQAQEEWEVRHGGLMGLKYLMAVRQVQNGWKTLFIKYNFNKCSTHALIGQQACLDDSI